MQETQKKLSLDLDLNILPPINGNSEKPMFPQGLFAPYHKQSHDMNTMMIQNHMTRELCHQLKVVEERAVFCLKMKDKAIEEATRKSVELEYSLKKALGDVQFWREISEQKTALTMELARRLLKVRKRESSMKLVAASEFAEEAQSSTGENGVDVEVDTAGTKRRRR